MEQCHFQVVLEWDPESRAWVTYVPVLDFLSTFGETREDALGNTREAVLGYLEAGAKEGLQVAMGDHTQAELVCLAI